MRTESLKNLAELSLKATQWNTENTTVSEAEFFKKEILDTIKRVIICEMMRPEVKRCKFDIFNYTAIDELRAVMRTVYHHNGHKVASDSHILVCLNAEYPEALEGMMMFKDGTLKANGDIGIYPNYMSVKPSAESLAGYEKVTLTQEDFDAMRKALKQWKLEKKVDVIDGEFVVVNGTYFKAELFIQKLIPFMETFKSFDLYVHPKGGRACMTENENGWCLIMPIMGAEQTMVDADGNKSESIIKDEETFKRVKPNCRAFFVNR